MAVNNEATLKKTGHDVKEIEDGSRTGEKHLSSGQSSETGDHGQSAIHKLEVSFESIECLELRYLSMYSATSTFPPSHYLLSSFFALGSLMDYHFNFHS